MEALGYTTEWTPNMFRIYLCDLFDLQHNRSSVCLYRREAIQWMNDFSPRSLFGRSTNLKRSDICTWCRISAIFVISTWQNDIKNLWNALNLKWLANDMSSFNLFWNNSVNSSGFLLRILPVITFDSSGTESPVFTLDGIEFFTTPEEFFVLVMRDRHQAVVSMAVTYVTERNIVILLWSLPISRVKRQKYM